MGFYIRIMWLCAIHYHISMVYSARPIFRVYKHNEEFIVEFPFGEMIITPHKTLVYEKQYLDSLEEIQNADITQYD